MLIANFVNGCMQSFTNWTKSVIIFPVMEMEKRIFLTGSIGCGKTRLLREVLGESIAFAGGFVTERRMDERDRFVGYELFPAAAAAGFPGYEGQLYLDCRCFPPVHDNEVYRVLGVRLLEEAPCYPYALLDELGGFELVIPQFRQALETLLNQDLPCVGALRSLEDAELLRKLLGLGERYEQHAARLHEALRDDPDTLLLDLCAMDTDAIRQSLCRWAEEYAR